MVDDRKPRRRKLSDDERVLWGRVTRSIAPLRRRRAPLDSEEPAPQIEPQHAAKPGPVARSEPSRQATLVAKPTPRQAPLERRLKQRLARGREPVDAKLDLHGRTQSEAHALLARFLRRAQADGAKVALVVTGKGARASEPSRERGVLKRQVPLWLGLPEFSPYVIGFDEADIGHGGSGALYVRIRRRRKID